MYISIAMIIVGLFLTILLSLKWSKLAGQTYINDEIVVRRKRYKTGAVFGLLISIAFCANLSFTYVEDTSLLLTIIIASVFFNSRIMFEPYYSERDITSIQQLCLYLRAFIDDGKNISRGRILLPLQIEKIISREFEKKVSQVYCIGNPNSCIPTTLSTSCVYASDDAWKDSVHSLYEKAYYTIIRVAETDGCMWELNHCQENGYLEKTLFFAENRESLSILKNKNILPESYDMDSLPNTPHFAFQNASGDWICQSITGERSVKKAISTFLAEKPLVMKNVKRKKACWTCALTFLINPLVCILVNNWKKKYWIPYALTLFAAIVLSIFFAESMIEGMEVGSEEHEDVFIGLMLFIFVPFQMIWSCIAPRISWISKKWGGESVFQKTNQSLFLWVLCLYCFLYLAEFIAVC